MRAVLISIQPKWCELIISGKKTIEVRRTKPKIETPFKCYIYCTKSGEYKYRVRLDENRVQHGEVWNGRVIGEFVCDKVYKFNIDELIKHSTLERLLEKSKLTYKELLDYVQTRQAIFYAWNISDFYGWRTSDLKIYDKPKALGELRKPCIDKYQYCQSCKYGLITLSPDEEEYAMYHGGYYDTFDTVCTNSVTRPPQSWCYVEELE